MCPLDGLWPFSNRVPSGFHFPSFLHRCRAFGYFTKGSFHAQLFHLSRWNCYPIRDETRRGPDETRMISQEFLGTVYLGNEFSMIIDSSIIVEESVKESWKSRVPIEKQAVLKGSSTKGFNPYWMRSFLVARSNTIFFFFFFFSPVFGSK